MCIIPYFGVHIKCEFGADLESQFLSLSFGASDRRSHGRLATYTIILAVTAEKLVLRAERSEGIVELARPSGSRSISSILSMNRMWILYQKT